MGYFYKFSISLAFIVISQLCYADVYVGYQNTVGNQTTIGSVPITGSGFSYTDSQGNSMGYREIRHVPVVTINPYPNGNWVLMNNGNVPFNAIASYYHNGRPIFYCRVFDDNQIYYGNLVPNEGCYLSNQSQPYNQYEALVR